MGPTHLDRNARYRSRRRLLVRLAVLAALVLSSTAARSAPLRPGPALGDGTPRLAHVTGYAQIRGEDPPTPVVEVHRRADGVDLEVHVFAPDDPAPDAPAVVLVHGGGWSSGGAADMAEWAQLLAEAGWVAFSIDYRLATEEAASWPLALEDVRSGLGWVRDNAARFGGDPENVAVLGESAGAHLAAVAAVDGTGGPDLAAVALWSPPLRLDTLVPDPTSGLVPGCGGNDACQEFWSMGWVTRFMGCHPGDCGSAYADANPIDRVGADTPPLWLANGTRELVPLDQPEAFASTLARAEVDHTVLAIEGPAHGHGYARQVWNPMVAWMADRLGVEVPEPVEFPGGPGPAGTVVVTALASALGLTILAVILARREDDAGPAPAGTTRGEG